MLISPKVGGAKLADGTMLKADGQLAGSPSQTVDAIAVILSSGRCKALLEEAAAVQFVMDAFGHLKAIGHTPEAKPLLDKAGVEPTTGVTGLGDDFIAAAAKALLLTARPRSDRFLPEPAGQSGCAGVKLRQQMAFVGKRQGPGDESRGALCSGSLCGSD